MACGHYGSGVCAKEQCHVLTECPEYVEPDQEWLLKDMKPCLGLLTKMSGKNS